MLKYSTFTFQIQVSLTDCMLLTFSQRHQLIVIKMQKTWRTRVRQCRFSNTTFYQYYCTEEPRQYYATSSELGTKPHSSYKPIYCFENFYWRMFWVTHYSHCWCSLINYMRSFT